MVADEDEVGAGRRLLEGLQQPWRPLLVAEALRAVDDHHPAGHHARTAGDLGQRRLEVLQQDLMADGLRRR